MDKNKREEKKVFLAIVLITISKYFYEGSENCENLIKSQRIIVKYGRKELKKKNKKNKNN